MSRKPIDSPASNVGKPRAFFGLSLLQSLLSLLLVLAIVINAHLLITNKSLRHSIDAQFYRDQLRIGEHLAAVEGVDNFGHRVSISNLQKEYLGRPVLLLSFSEGCPYCKEQWTAWAGLISHAKRSSAPVVAIDLSDQYLDAPLARNNNRPLCTIPK